MHLQKLKSYKFKEFEINFELIIERIMILFIYDLIMKIRINMK